MQLKTTLGDGLSQAGFELQAVGGQRREGFCVEVETVATIALGLVHGGIGVADQFRCGFPIVGEHADADAGAHIDLLPAVQREGLIQGLQNGRSDLCRLLWLIQLLEHQQEFVAAQATQGVFLPDALTQAFGHLPQQAVASGVTQAVVDRLEVVEVDEDDAQLSLVALGQIDGVLQALMQHDPVWQFGQLIEVRHAGQSGLGFLERGDVGEHAHEVRGLTVRRTHRADGQLDHQRVAIFALKADFVFPLAVSAQLRHHTCDGFLRVLGEQELGAVTQHVGFGVPRELGEGAVDGHQMLVGVQHDHAFVRAFQGSGVQAHALLILRMNGLVVQIAERK